jgi:hypothetical protein
MTALRSMFVILIITAGLVLAAGCMGQNWDGKTLGNVPSPVFITPIPTLMQIESSVVPQESYYWIKIDPIGDKVVGETFTITSTTNVSTGEEILVQVYPANHFNGPKMQTWEFYGASGTVKVIQGSNGINTILFVVNSSTLYKTSPLEPGEYIVSEDAIRQDASTGILFNVNPRPVHHPGIWDLWPDSE